MTYCPECLELLEEIRWMDEQIQQWQARRTMGGPPGDYTYGWRNVEIPRVRPAWEGGQ